MRLKRLILENFRCYRDRQTVELGDLTAFIGRNDAGKSTILEALEIFFNSDVVSIEKADLAVDAENDVVRIGCVFSDLPTSIVLDATANSSLSDEYLLNGDGDLEVHKLYRCNVQKRKPAPIAAAVHPRSDGAHDLLQLKNAALKTRARERNVDLTDVDQRSNPKLRKRIWESFDSLNLGQVEVPLDTEDGKRIWATLEKHLPMYALCQADRPSRDDDSAVQDPMKLAVATSLQGVAAQLEDIKQHVQQEATQVAQRTLAKLQEMDRDLAAELRPVFRAEPKWDSLFKLSLLGDNDIPINKRGSGVRRLVLLNFFRAEVERRADAAAVVGTIYAVEEPETSQHPRNQELVVRILADLAEQEATQVVLTTHVPGLAANLPNDSLRYVQRRMAGGRLVRYGDDEVLKDIARDLGVVPDSRVRGLLAVEGPHDVRFLKAVAAVLHRADPQVIDLATDPRIAFLVLGGSTLQEWVTKHFLSGLQKPEFHLYDRDVSEPPTYQQACDEVNARGDGSTARLTSKRELENYLHPEAVFETFGVTVDFDHNDDVPAIVAAAVHEAASDATGTWDELAEDKRSKKESRAKRRLNEEAATRMTVERLRDRGGLDEVREWLHEIEQMARGE